MGILLCHPRPCRFLPRNGGALAMPFLFIYLFIYEDFQQLQYSKILFKVPIEKRKKTLKRHSLVVLSMFQHLFGGRCVIKGLKIKSQRIAEGLEFVDFQNNVHFLIKTMQNCYYYYFLVMVRMVRRQQDRTTLYTVLRILPSFLFFSFLFLCFASAKFYMEYQVNRTNSNISHKLRFSNLNRS